MSRIAVICAIGACSVAGPPQPSDASERSPVLAKMVKANPGAVVRWTGAGIDSCSSGGSSWSPYDGACWFPIDVAAEPGRLEISRARAGTTERVSIQVAESPYPTQRLTVAPEMTTPPADQLERIAQEGQRVDALWRLGGPPAFELPLYPPLDPMPEPRSFGSRRVLNGEPRTPHSGVDLSAPRGTPVVAAARGRVAIAADHYFSGRSVFLDHGDDLVSMYFHLDRIDVREGELVQAGQPIGAVGSTGRSTGPHLHFGVRWHGARIDPALLLGDSVRILDITSARGD
jgi:murein DD-endopeptidase MepM/ murein hydrolase activator NlpD